MVVSRVILINVTFHDVERKREATSPLKRLRAISFPVCDGRLVPVKSGHFSYYCPMNLKCAFTFKGSNRHFPKFLATSLTETNRLSPCLDVRTSMVSHFSRRCHPLRFGTAVVQEVIKDLQICNNLPSWCARCRVVMCFLWVWSGVNGGMSWRWCCKDVEILVFTKSVAYELCNQRTSPQSQNLNYLNGLSKWGDPTLDVSTAYSSQTEGILPWNGKMDVMDPTMQAHLAGYVPTGSWPPAQLCRRCKTIPFCWDGSPVAAKAWRACRNPYVHPLSERILCLRSRKDGFRQNLVR